MGESLALHRAQVLNYQVILLPYQFEDLHREVAKVSFLRACQLINNIVTCFSIKLDLW